MQQKHTGKKVPDRIRGVLTITAKGIGYLKTDTPKDKIEIAHQDLKTGLQGDFVEVQILGKMIGGARAKVHNILGRAKAGFTGELSMKDGEYVLIPTDPKMYAQIVIPKGELGKAKIGEKIFAAITEWKSMDERPQGSVIEVLGKPFEHNAEMRGIALERGFAEAFPKKVEAEARALYENYTIPKSGRKDFRDITTFTIDPFDAKDFDDAISIEPLKNGNYNIGVHIADVGHFVKVGSELDKEAFKRGTSVYLVDRTIPMLPEVLSNDLCSLKPDVDRLTFSALFTITPDGNVLDMWFGKSIIHSNKRFTYEEAQKILDDKKGLYYDELDTLNTIAKKLHHERHEQGSITLEQDEVKFILDAHGVPTDVYTKTRTDTHKLVEEWMLLANRKVAEHIGGTKNDKQKKKRVFVYRIHDLPDKGKVQDLAFFIKKLGYHLPLTQGVARARDINILLKQLEGKAERDTVQTAIIRSMAKAIYSTKNIGHFGLGFESYTHFTSPIRRYPDVAVHRLLFSYLHNIDPTQKALHEFEEISRFTSDREKSAQDAERASVKYKQVEYMGSRIGKEFEGLVTGVTEWGLYVEERKTKSEGMVRIRDIGDDFYVFDERALTLTGKKTKKRYRLGDRVTVRVKNADLGKRLIEYTLVK